MNPLVKSIVDAVLDALKDPPEGKEKTFRSPRQRPGENLPPEDPIVVIADAVNQLAINVEHLTLGVSISPSMRQDVRRRLIKIREDIAPLIPD
jgi:hypothetical protein